MQNPQDKPHSPDKLGHLFLHAALITLLLLFLSPIHSVILTMFFAFGIEVVEAKRWKGGNLREWLLMLDTAYDFVADLLGLLLGLFWHPPIAIAVYAFLSYLFGRFVDWKGFKEKWWDFNPFHHSL